jgi:hypothetical protein
LQIEEIDILIEKAEREIQVLDKQKRVLRSNKLQSKKGLQKKLKPIDD